LTKLMGEAASFEHPHRDPIDRMIGAQALPGDIALVNRDAFFRELKLKVIW